MRIQVLILILFCFSLSGCSLPTRAAQPELYSLIREEKKIKGGFGKKKMVSIRDFRGREMYEEDISALKEEAEKYISCHPDLSEAIKANLRELKVVVGETKEAVELLLDEPDKITRAGTNARYGASEIWIYKISRLRAFTVFIVPVFFVHEGYYLYFMDDILVGIEKHYLEQIIRQGSAPGVPVTKK